jgi:Predicted ATPase of the PP-loop superfamily implicated in cell cycle control
LARGFAVLPAAPGFARKVKPFCRFYERETAAYAILREIAYLPEECPYAGGSKQLFFKEDLNRWEDEMPGTKLRFYLNYLAALDEGVFPERQEEAEVLSGKLCARCGQPTTAGELCAFCRMFEE